MRYYIVIESGYVLLVGTGEGGEEITEERYNEILEIIREKPAATLTTDYKLKSDFTWEPYEIEPPEPEPTVEDKAEAYDILMGVSE